MPILRQEPSYFPENLFGGYEAGDRRWWTVYTKARQEKALARDLLQRGVPFYLPQIPKTELRKGRRYTSQIPLFQSYVFLLGTDEDRRTALTTNRISRVLEVSNHDEMFTDLSQVARLIQSNAPLAVEKRLEPGRRVRVKAGPMQGLEGTVVSRRGEFRLMIAVHFLQQGVSMEVDDFNVEPLD